MGGTLKKECNRHLKNLGNLLQSARSDSVCTLFVFLHLLEREFECIAELFLAHPQHHATHSYPAAHVLVDGVGSFLRHYSVLLLFSPGLEPDATDQTRSAITRTRGSNVNTQNSTVIT